MRYRIGTEPPQPGASAHDPALYVEGGMGLLIGITLLVVALRGRQRWLAIWGGTLVVAASIYLIALVAGVGLNYV